LEEASARSASAPGDDDDVVAAAAAAERSELSSRKLSNGAKSARNLCRRDGGHECYGDGSSDIGNSITCNNCVNNSSNRKGVLNSKGDVMAYIQSMASEMKLADDRSRSSNNSKHVGNDECTSRQFHFRKQRFSNSSISQTSLEDNSDDMSVMVVQEGKIDIVNMEMMQSLKSYSLKNGPDYDNIHDDADAIAKRNRKNSCADASTVIAKNYKDRSYYQPWESGDDAPPAAVEHELYFDQKEIELNEEQKKMQIGMAFHY